MTKKIKFVFGIHNHQPIGNFDFVFEDAYQRSYSPFIEVLEKHPKIRIAIHFTGILLDWIEDNHPELIEKIKKMTQNGQLELMSGAYYEPIISVIPEDDRIGQIMKLTRRVKQTFNYDATGMWLAERIWEPTLPSTLSKAGIKYSVIDDTHFKYAGLTDNDLTGYFVTEDLGRSVFLFPINKHLRYTIPFQDPQETINLLKSAATVDGQNVIVFADDGEKFGVWPDTYKHVYENGWLDRFFTVLEKNLDWIELNHFDEIYWMVAPKGNIYLPTASYAEMMHWSLFPESFRTYEGFEHYLVEQGVYNDVGIFVRGGFWRNFMSKYPEINYMHKKMLRVSRKLHEAEKKYGDKLKAAFDFLWAGQCNCPYWHGVFGGVYLSHLRHAIYNSLINAEKILDQLDKPDFPIIETTDFDVDGHEEVLVEAKVHNAYFKLNHGAMMFEYDYKAAAKNLLDNISRREEGYHSKLKDAQLAGEPKKDDSTASIHDIILTKEKGLENYLNYDWYDRKSFIDHFFDASVTINDFNKSKFRDLGDFVNQPFQLMKKSSDKLSARLLFVRNGNIWLGEQPHPLKIEKNITISNDQAEILAEYKLINGKNTPLNLRFAVEFNFGLQAGQAYDRYYLDENGKLKDFYLNSNGIIENSKYLGLRDEYMKIDISLTSENETEIWRTPVETVSLSEAGFERVYQSSSVVFIWNIQLVSTWHTSIKQVVNSL